ncbi:protein SypD [Parasalinivibrio latis]|uniref:protein SypD n=1 Tax=Parasalinivibrio latis TaxID=2952610 RepID=UPI0030E1FEB9
MSIPPLNMEIEQVYSQIMRHQYRTLTVTSANAGEGVTSLALALSQRNLLAGHSTLIVDLNLYHPSLENLGLEIHRPNKELTLLESPQLVGVPGENITLTGISAPSKRANVMQLRRPEVLEQYIKLWHQDYDLVIFDTSPVSRVNANNIPPERVACASDGTLLVVMSGTTTESAVLAAIKKLNDGGAHLLGTVINDKHSPTLKAELLRELDRFKSKTPKLVSKLKDLIFRNKLLSVDL